MRQPDHHPGSVQPLSSRNAPGATGAGVSQEYEELCVSKLSQRLFELTRRPKGRLDFRNEGRLWLPLNQSIQDLLGSIVD